MNTNTFLEVKDLAVTLSGQALLKGVSFSLARGQQLAVIGRSGSGKTTLVNALSGRIFAAGSVAFGGPEKPRTAVITQHHQFRNLSNLSSFYYQQRFNSDDSQDTETVMQTLLAKGFSAEAIRQQLEEAGIGYLAGTRLIQLSNGEHKRFQLANALLKQPDWLLLDSPYTGLDAGARARLNRIIDRLAAKGMQVLLVTSDNDIPSCITHVATLANGRMAGIQSRTLFDVHTKNSKAITDSTIRFSFPDQELTGAETDFSFAVRMINTRVEYGNRKILDGINWEVRNGERWSVSGDNGSGKSTLLSLVNGDNPQAFANEIYLFDRKKGSGETIWEIKQRIGYVSPELHHYFEPGISCAHVVASGLFDTIGLFRKLNTAQQQKVNRWMELLQVQEFAERPFRILSNGEQRLVLLARALVKNPPLLILDEPCQGLDANIAAKFIAMINEICVQLNKTLIYVSHYESEIPPCITHKLKLEQGRIAA